MKQKVVIIGHGYASRLGVIRSVAQIGCEITVIVMTGYNRGGKTLNFKKPIDCYSKYVSNVYYCYSKDSEGLVQLLLKKCTDPLQKVIIIPDSDLSAVYIDQKQEILEKHFLFPHICHQPNTIIQWMNKVKQKELAKILDMKVAEACVIEIKNQQYTIPSSVNYPCFTKPLATIAGGKRLLKKCNNVRELNDVLEEASRIADVKILIEDFKPIEKEYAIVGFSDGKNVVIPGVIEMLIVSQSRPGITLKGKVLPLIGFEEIVAKFKQYILAVGLVGLFDIDFYMTGGHFYFCELNLRFGGSGYAFTKMGWNLPAMLVQYLTNMRCKYPPKKIHREAVFVNERLCIEDWYQGYLSSDEFVKILQLNCIKFIYDSEDFAPQKYINRMIKVMRIKRFIKRLVGIKLNKIQ